MHPRLPALASVAVLALALAACAGDGSPVPAADPAVDDHGVVAGAAEVAEPQLGLTTVDADGAVRHLDLLDEQVSDVGMVGRPTAVGTDGRYLFAQTAAGLEVVDSGRWTWDHTDHFHYYRSDPRLLGAVPGAGEATVATTNLSTTGGIGVFFAGSGDAVLLDAAALSRGEVVERFRLPSPPHPGLVVPVGAFALVTTAEGRVVGYAADGEPTGLDERCVDASGTVTTRVGAVLGCRDGALLATVRDDALVVERIPYPDDVTAPPAAAFANREGRPTVAALAGERGVWLLDTRARAWTLLPAPAPLVGVTAVDDADEHLLALTADGRVLVLDGSDGSVRARTEPLVSDSLDAGATPVLVADQQRAYLSAPVERRLYEIDFADDARIARTFSTPTEPAFLAATGR